MAVPSRIKNKIQMLKDIADVPVVAGFGIRNENM